MVKMNTKEWLRQRLPQENKNKNALLPKISVITPSYNSERFLEQTIRSVILQRYSNLEYIVVDGGSTDNTVNIIKQYSPWISTWLSEPDSGQSEAINKGLKLATGEWVAWINADDIYTQDALIKIAKIIKDNKETSWIVGSTLYVDNEFNIIGKFNPELYSANGNDAYYKKNGWLDYVCTKRSGIALPQPSSFWKREAINEVGLLDESLQFAMDHELYGRLAKHGLTPYIFRMPIALFRIHTNQKTSQSPNLFMKEEKLIVKRLILNVPWIDKFILGKYLIWFNAYLLKKKYKSLLHNIINLIFK